MKSTCKVLSLLLCGSLLLSGCTAAPAAESTPSPVPTENAAVTPQPEAAATPVPTQAPSLQLSLEEYPRVDGSTANLPLMAAVLSKLTGISPEQAETLTTCATTPYAYENLVEGNADILLVYEPAEETKEFLDGCGVELEFVPIGRDALVFIANEANPVQGLTTQQLIDIYTGKITNWQQVGGSDQEIVPFQRASASGSQALFMKLLMKDTAPMEAPIELYPSEMGELIERLAEYNNEGTALGFSVFYYASYMYSKPGLKFLAVDGVAPSDETIADATYPFLNEFYVVYRADEPEDSPVRKIAGWLTSGEGKTCLLETGYIPVP